MQTGLPCTTVLYVTASVEVTHGDTFGVWACLEGTQQPSHMSGTSVELARRLGPPEPVHCSTDPWLLSTEALGPRLLTGQLGVPRASVPANKVGVT